MLESIDNWLRSLFGDGGHIYDNAKATIILLATMIFIGIIITIILRVISRQKVANSSRAITIRTMLMRFIRIVLVIYTLIYVLEIWGIDTKVILASLSVFGVALAFGSQELVKDIISGIFLILDNRFDVGDLVEIDGFKGNIVEIGLKTTKIRNFKNETLTINNGDIKDNINYYYLKTETLNIDVGIAYEHDINHVNKIIEDFLPRINLKYPELITPIVYRGLTSMGDNAIILSFLITTETGKAYGFKHNFHKELKILFDEAGISIPFPQVTMHDSNKNPVSKDVTFTTDNMDALLNISSEGLEEELERRRKLRAKANEKHSLFHKRKKKN